ncbi:dynein light chain Tctex-type protein 2 isoform X2 [Sceloporus undulatus]|nr:dynein light chain Tctex-type protein 2 isoform X2 [Sceloporus undulatus]XP_042301096.1 dynein light chain Tctex-type protein 2 isoform X2 [Sceloporus undulatus]
MAKHRASSHDVSGSEPDDDSLTDFTKTDLLAFKSTFAKPKYANTYRMEPYRKFEPHVVKKKVEEILKNKLQDFRYSGPIAASTCTDLTDTILQAVTELGFDRYKYVVQVFLVEKTGQSIHIASRWVWDVARDNWIQGQQETENYVVVALIIACYYE